MPEGKTTLELIATTSGNMKRFWGRPGTEERSRLAEGPVFKWKLMLTTLPVVVAVTLLKFAMERVLTRAKARMQAATP